MNNEEPSPTHPAKTNSSRSLFWILIILFAVGNLAGCVNESEVSEPGEPLPPPPTERTADEIMAERPFAPKNIDLFDPELYPDATTMPTAQGLAPTEGEVREMLIAYANEDPNMTADEALAVFDDPIVKQKFESPRLLHRSAPKACRATNCWANSCKTCRKPASRSVRRRLLTKRSLPAWIETTEILAQRTVSLPTGRCNSILDNK